MKNQTLSILAFTALSLGALSCKNEKKAEATEAKAVEEVAMAETYKAVPAETYITWDADKLVGGHEGTINASTGTLDVKGNEVVGGNFIIDVNSIKVTDLEAGEQNDKLVGHLKAEDFFDVAKFPNGAFQITSVSPKDGKTMVAGNLTLKGVKKNIEFPAMVSVSNGMATVKSEPFSIDRTMWNINYNSGKMTDAAALGDKLIKDNVGIVVHMTAKK